MHCIAMLGPGLTLALAGARMGLGPVGNIPYIVTSAWRAQNFSTIPVLTSAMWIRRSAGALEAWCRCCSSLSVPSVCITSEQSGF